MQHQEPYYKELRLDASKLYIGWPIKLEVLWVDNPRPRVKKRVGRLGRCMVYLGYGRLEIRLWWMP